MVELKQIPRATVSAEDLLPPRWPYKRHSFPNGQSSYWIKWKLWPGDQRFFSTPKVLTIKFDKELDQFGNDNISVFNDWKITKLSYSTNLPKLCEELNFFSAMYDQEGELITSLFRIKYLIDIDTISYTMKNFKAFKDLCYKTIFTPTMLEKIEKMIEENYSDDIEAENERNMQNPDMANIMQKKKKSLEFLNVHVKAILKISFAIKILSIIINHFIVMRSLNLQKNIQIMYDFYFDAFSVFGFEFSIFNKLFSYIENKVNSSYNYNRSIFEQQEIEGKDKAIIVNQLLTKNVIIDNFIKFQMPQTWNSIRNQPKERVLSFLRSIVNTHINIFLIQVFKRNLIETTITPDVDGNSKNDRYRASKMKINEEHITISTLDLKQIVTRLFQRYEHEITKEEIEYYRRNLKPSRLHQLMIEIYFFRYVGSSQEFSLLRNIDWYKLLLCMRNDIMHRFGVSKENILDAALPLIITSNIEEHPVGEKTYIKDLKYLAENEVFQKLEQRYYKAVTSINDEAIKKLLISFANSRYTFSLYEHPSFLDKEVEINKRQLIDELLTFLILSNENIVLLNEDNDEEDS
jgi:hypothetical protein